MSCTKYWNKVYDQMCTETLTLIHIVRARDVLITASFLHSRLQLCRIGDALGKGS